MTAAGRKKTYKLDGIKVALIREYLEENHMSITDLVDEYNARHARRNDRLSASTLQRNYSGRNEPNWRRIERLATLLGCTRIELHKQFEEAKRVYEEEAHKLRAARRTREADADLVDEDGHGDFESASD